MPQNRDRHERTRIGLAAALLISLAACGGDGESSNPAGGSVAPPTEVDVKPPPAAEEAAPLPEFHGAYWLSDGEWVRLAAGEENRVVVPADVRLLIFDPSIAAGFGSRVRGPVRHRFLRYAVQAASPAAMRTGSGGRRVSRVDAWHQDMRFLEVRTRPVEGQPAMLEVIPAESLPPGRYRWDISRPRAWLEVRGAADDAATFDKFEDNFFPPDELDTVLSDLTREADDAAKEEEWTQRALRLRRVLLFQPDDIELKFEIALAQARAARAHGSSATAAERYREAIRHLPARRAEVEAELAEVLDGERVETFLDEAFERKRSGVRYIRITADEIPPDVRALPGFEERLRTRLMSAVRANAQTIQAERYRPLAAMVATYEMALERHSEDEVALATLRGYGGTQARFLVADLQGHVKWGRVNTDDARAAVQLGGHDHELLLQVSGVVAKFAKRYLERSPDPPEPTWVSNDQRLAQVMAVLELREGFPVADEHAQTLRSAAQRASAYWRHSRRDRDDERATWWEAWQSRRSTGD